MRIPLGWLRDYVDFQVDAQTLAHDLTMSGTKIETVHAPAADFQGVFVGKVLDCRAHPNADKLTLCRVDVGGEGLHIVCGAPNVRKGLTVAVARVGARLAGNVRIRRTKIRGEVSEGMICSARELGLGEEADGILELDAGLTSGAPFTAAAADAILVAEITPNRPDCLGLIGVAREVAALYGGALHLPEVWSGEPAQPAAVGVDIESPDDCARYLGRAIRNLRVGPSPDWLRQRLAAVGLEPINNVVDITNYVLFETGQPIHAFDLEALGGGRIVVRRARHGERLRTLDGVERTLDPEILVIADANRPVALAGIMGGAESAVRETTRHVLLEVAWFRPDLVRSARRKLGIDTESSYRFERGADVEAVRWVADRATRLLVELAGGEVRESWADTYPRRGTPVRVQLRVGRANRLIGTALGAEEMAALLRRLEIEAVPRGDALDVRVPSFRRDLHEEIDLVEEVARVHGYDKIPSDSLPPAPLQPVENGRESLLERLRLLLVGLGYFEVRTSAFMERRDPERLQLGPEDPRQRAVCVRNPIVSTLDTLRTSLVPGILRVVRHNLNREAESLRLVEIDRVFLDVPGGPEGLPRETEKLVAVACGARHPESWADATRPCDLFDLKGDAESLLEHLGVDSVWSAGYTEPFFDPGTTFLISGSYGSIGGGGAVHERVLQAFDIGQPVFLLELDVESLERHLAARREFRGVPRFPAVKRDLSLVVPRRVAYGDVRAAVVVAAGAILESVHCFDVFEERALGPELRSIGLRLRFRSAERTLTDAVVDAAIAAVLQRLQERGVQLRAVGGQGGPPAGDTSGTRPRGAAV